MHSLEHWRRVCLRLTKQHYCLTSKFCETSNFIFHGKRWRLWPDRFWIKFRRNKCIFIDSSYLNTGIGNAWAWHKSAKSWAVLRVIADNCTSLLKAGDLEPTGSTIKVKLILVVYLITWKLAPESLGLDTKYSDSDRPSLRTKTVYYRLRM